MAQINKCYTRCNRLRKFWCDNIMEMIEAGGLQEGDSLDQEMWQLGMGR